MELSKQELIDKIKLLTEQTSISGLCEILDFFLQGNLDEKIYFEEKEMLLNALNNLLKNNNGYIALAQINPIVGDIEYNSKKVMKYINSATSIGVDMIVFPELTLMGYPIQDTIDRHPVIVEENLKWLKEIAKLTKNTYAVVGFIEPRTDGRGKRYYNSLAVLGEGEIKGIIRKSLLPTYSEFNDYRYIEPSPVAGNQSPETLGKFSPDNVVNMPKTNNIHGISYGISVCEDCWNNDEFFSNPLYKEDPVSELCKDNPDILINCSASPSRAKKEQLKHNIIR